MAILTSKLFQDLLSLILTGATLAFFLALRGRSRQTGFSGRGLLLIILGLGLCTFGDTLDLADEFPVLDETLLFGRNMPYHETMEDLVGSVLGFTLFMVGLLVWVPSFVRSRTQDLTFSKAELQEAKACLEDAYQRLVSVDKVKDEFLSSVSHELRTPLTSIRSFSEILLRYEDTDPGTAREFLRIINGESERLTRLINDLLDFSRIEAGRMVWNDEPFPLRELVHEVAKTQVTILMEKDLELSIDVPDDLPPVLADRDRISQVLLNILGNAVKFSARGGTIWIQAEPFEGKRFAESSPWLRVGVRDQGIGIDPKDHVRIFERFSQGSVGSLDDKPRGSGLGLTICREIITHYGGNIWVESQKGHGSTFFLSLPATLPAAAECPRPREAFPELPAPGPA